MLIFFRKVPGMELNGTLGYNMNLLTELSELLVESCPTYFQCVDATCRPFSVVLISYLATEMRAAIISEELKSLIISHQILRDCKLWFDFHSSRTCSCLCRLFCLSDKHLTAETQRKTTSLGLYLTPFPKWLHLIICKQVKFMSFSYFVYLSRT